MCSKHSYALEVLEESDVTMILKITRQILIKVRKVMAQ